jgi:hypothetical protein
MILLIYDAYDIKKLWNKITGKVTLPYEPPKRKIYLVKNPFGQIRQLEVIERSATTEHLKIWRYDPGYMDKEPQMSIWVEWLTRQEFEEDYTIIERL